MIHDVLGLFTHPDQEWRLPVFMNVDPDEGFMFSSSVLAVGLVVLVAIMAFTVVLWGAGVGPEYTKLKGFGPSVRTAFLGKCACSRRRCVRQK